MKNWEKCIYKNLLCIGVWVIGVGVVVGVLSFFICTICLKHALSIIGGGIALIGIGVAARRIKQFEATLQNQEKNLKNQEKTLCDQQEQIAIQERGLFADRLKAGIELLHSGHASQQSDAIEWLHALAKDRKDSKEDRDLILKILCTFVRVKSRELVDTDEGNLMDKMKKIVQKISGKEVKDFTSCNSVPLSMDNQRPHYQEHRDIFEEIKKYHEVIQKKIDSKREDMRSVHRAIQLISHPDNKDMYDSTQIDLSYSFIWDCKLDKAHLKGANLRGVYWDGLSKYEWKKDVDLTRANLNEAYLVRHSDVSPGTRCEGEGLKGEGAHLEHAYLLDVNLSGGTLCNAQLCDAHVLYSYLTNVNLERAILTRVHFLYHVISASMSGACLQHAIMGAVGLYGANLSEVNFEGCEYLSGARLSGIVSYRGAIVDVEHKTRLENVKENEVGDIIWCHESGTRYVYREQPYGSIEEAQNALRLNRQSGA